MFDYITEGDSTIFEQDSLQNLAKDGEIFTYKHKGFWKPMDTLRDKQKLQKLWEDEKAPCYNRIYVQPFSHYCS